MYSCWTTKKYDLKTATCLLILLILDLFNRKSFWILQHFQTKSYITYTLNFQLRIGTVFWLRKSIFESLFMRWPSHLAPAEPVQVRVDSVHGGAHYTASPLTSIHTSSSPHLLFPTTTTATTSLPDNTITRHVYIGCLLSSSLDTANSLGRQSPTWPHE